MKNDFRKISCYCSFHMVLTKQAEAGLCQTQVRPGYQVRPLPPIEIIPTSFQKYLVVSLPGQYACTFFPSYMDKY